MKKLLFNIQIEALDYDHGKKIVEFYKNNGINTTSYTGIMHRKDGDTYRYYGCDSLGSFKSRTITEFINKDIKPIKTITLEQAKELVNEKTLFTIKDLADGKCVVINDGTVEELHKVLNEVKEGSAKTYGTSKYFWTEGIYHWANDYFNNRNLPIQSVADFLKQVKPNMRKKDNRFPFELSAKNAKRIIDAACPLWQEKLAGQWSVNVVLDRHTKISEDDYKTMRKACTNDQNKLFDEIFGKDVVDNSVDLSNIEITGNDIIGVRQFVEHENKGFFLTSDYNWEIVTDSQNQKVLIPTKK